MYELIENYIYLYHLDQYVVLPAYPDSIADSLSASFNSAQPMLRSAPIFSYSNSGPRQMQVTLSLPRDLMTQVNYGVSNFNLEIGEDYVDVLIKQLQAVALPRYSSTQKMVDPPMVAVRFGNDIFIKGVVVGGITTTLSKPIMVGDKYNQVTISFNVQEITPYDAETVQKDGLFRGLSTTLERKIYKH